jgi:hypothetical protein
MCRPRPTTIRGPHSVIGEVEDYFRGLDWVADAGARARDEGHVFHVEYFVVPRDGSELSVKTIEQVRTAFANIDWRMLDVVVCQCQPSRPR